MNCTLLTIGDEILIGQIVDTNSAWMAKQLNAIGIRVAEIISLSDSQQHIVEGLDRALAQSDIVLITGGLGPTKDDITKNVLADYFQSDLTFYPHIYAQLEEYLKSRGIAVVDAIHQMAMLPTKCLPFITTLCSVQVWASRLLPKKLRLSKMPFRHTSNWRICLVWGLCVCACRQAETTTMP